MINKKNLTPIIVLTVICIAAALLLALVNMVAGPEIEAAQQEAMRESLGAVATNDNPEFVELEKPADASDNVTGIYQEKTTGLYAVTVERQGYASVIHLTVGVLDGKITKVVITSEQETHGQTDFSAYPDSFAGKEPGEVPSVDVVTKATISSTAVKNGVVDALLALGYEIAVSEGRADDEILTYARDVVSEWKEFERVELKSTDGAVKRAFREKSGKGYVVYVHTYAQWGGHLESETVVCVDNSGKIVGINSIFWSVNHTIEQGAPTDDAFREALDTYIGKDGATLDEAELVTGATGTASNIRGAISEALATVYRLRTTTAAARAVGIVIACLAVAATVSAIVVSKRRRR